MGDFKVNAAIRDICWIVDGDGTPTSGLSVTHADIDPSANRATRSADDDSNGWYSASFTPDEAGLWGTEFTVSGDYTVYGAMNKINVGGGVIDDITDAIGESSATNGSHNITTANDKTETTIVEINLGYIFDLSMSLDYDALETAGEGGTVTITVYNKPDGTNYADSPIGLMEYVVGSTTVYPSFTVEKIHNICKIMIECSADVTATRAVSYEYVSTKRGD